MKLGFTFPDSLPLRIIQLGQHVIPTMLWRCCSIQLKFVFGLQRPAGELFQQHLATAHGAQRTINYSEALPNQV
jgi:hypothetical protein